MIFINDMKNLKIYKTKTFLPTVLGDKKKGSAILLMSPNYDSSKRLMNNPMFTNSNRFASYYMENDISYYINSKNIEEVDESVLLGSQAALISCLESKRSDLSDSEFGVPDKRKFPLDTEAHVRSAIKFFNYVDPEDEEELSKRIIESMKKFNITDVKVGKNNRFGKYYHSSINESAGIPGSHRILSRLDLIYYGWKYGTIAENDARERIAQMINGDGGSANPDSIPTPDEHFASYGKLTSVGESVEVNNLRETLDTNYFVRETARDNIINLGDKIMFFGESSTNDNYIKRLIYASRIRHRKDLLNILSAVKTDNPWIKNTFPELAKYNKRNIFVDLYYYNSIFFENNAWVLDKGMNLYLTFMERLLTHPNITKAGYKKKTIFIPVADWDRNRDASVWNYRKSINPISCLYHLMYSGAGNRLKNTFKDTDLVFIGNNCYFKINFNEIEINEVPKLSIKFKNFCINICKNQEFNSEDIDTSADYAEKPDVISAKIADKIELSKGVDITPQLHKAKVKYKNNVINADPKAAAEDKKIINKSMLGANASEDSLTSQSSDNIKKLQKDKADAMQDPDSVSMAGANEEDEDNQKDKDLQKLADAINKAAENNDTEDDTMDDLDSDEIKRILATLGNDDEVNISDARASRMSELEKKLLDKEINGKSIRDILDDTGENEEEEATTIDVASPNKEEWSNLTYMNFDKHYNIDRDIINIFRFFNTCKRPIVVRDIKVSDTSTSEDRINLYDVDMEDYRGKRYRIKLDIPIMVDNRFLLRGSYKSIQTQFFNMPIIKTDLGVCQLISNYKKIFLYRCRDKGGSTLPAVSKFIKACKKYQGNKIKIEFGDNTKVCTKYNLPIDYIDIAGIIAKIESPDWIVYFNQDEIRKEYEIEEGKGFPFAFNKKLNAVEYYPPELVEPFIKMLTLNVFKQCPEFQDLFNAASRPSRCSYSVASIMSAKIPIMVLCGYHIGLRAAMERAGIEYKLVSKIDKETRHNVDFDWVEFNDGYVVYNITYESSLLMNGLKCCSTEMHSLGEIDSRDMYLEFLDNYGGRIKADGLDNFYDLFVDPMIKESLEYYKLPTDYIDIMLYGNAMLNDNKFIKHTDASSRRLRRYQLIAVYTYQVLSTAYGYYANQLRHNKQSAEFSVKQSAVIDKFLTDTISSDDSCINALRDVETTNSITTKGPSGMNSERAYSLDKRAYTDSMLNVLGMSTGFAGNVGITRQATINSNVTKDGYVKAGDGSTENMNDANTLTATEALIPFGSTRDDPMRTAMSFIQTSKHSVRTEESDPLLVTNGADEVMPYLTTDKFAYKAKDGGIILEVDEHHILIQYDNGDKEYINLDEVIEKNSDGGYYVPLKLDAADGIKVGMKFKKNFILAYDKLSFSNSLGESNNLAYNVGKLAKVAVLNTEEGFEDSGIISASMAKKLATRVDLKYDVVINKDSRVFSIASVGDHIEASDTLIMWEDEFDDEDASQLMTALSDSGEDVSEIGKRKLKSEVTGVLKGIKIFRTVEIEELSPSLQKIVTEYEKPYVQRAKVLKDNGLSIAGVPAHYVLPPTGKLKKAQEAVLIEFYVEYLDTVGIGDKIVYNAANKAVEKDIFPEGKEPYTAFRPEEKIDAFVADSSVSKRLVTSTFIYGSLQKLMIELDRSVKDIMGIPYDVTKL